MINDNIFQVIYYIDIIFRIHVIAKQICIYGINEAYYKVVFLPRNANH
jgi:hypothetical protein